MPDDRLTPILGRLDQPHAPSPAFAAELLGTLRPMALEAGLHDATALGRLRRAVPVGRPRVTPPARWLVAAVVALLVMAVVAALLGRRPAAPFLHDSSFGFFQVRQEGEVATATAVARGVVAASPDSTYVLVNDDWPLASGRLSIERADGGGARALPSEPGEVTAAWSTDDQLAWAVAATALDPIEPASALHLVRPGQPTVLSWLVPQGTGPTRSGIGSFAWSPNGRQLAVTTTTQDLADHLYVVDSATAIGHELGTGVKPGQVAWSPDGASIAVVLDDTGDSAGTFELITIDVSNGIVSQHGRYAGAFAWARDGGLLIFGEGGMWRVRPGQPGRELVATMPDLSGPLVPSPDGSMVAFTTGATGPDLGGSLWVVPSTGGQPRLLGDGLWYRWHPSWSPDGDWVLFTRGPVGSRSLWMVRPDGTALQQVVAPGSGSGGVRASP